MVADRPHGVPGEERHSGTCTVYLTLFSEISISGMIQIQGGEEIRSNDWNMPAGDDQEDPMGNY